MRNLYARFILWLIQPALERHSCAGVAAPVWTLSSDGMLHIGIATPRSGSSNRL